MFSQFHPKVTKSMSRGAFSFALRESRLLEKAASWIQPFGWLLAFMGQKPKPKAKRKTKHTLKIILPPFLFICRWIVQNYTIQRQIKRNGGSS
jgi:hypothetical protein